MRRGMTRRWAAAGMILTAVAAGVTIAQAQQYPNKPVRIVVGFAAGSGPDVLARAIATQLGTDLGHNFIVENRPGANGTIAAQLAARAQPDGHTLLSALVNNAINDLLHPNACCRLNHELAPVAHFSLSPLVMVIHPSVPETTLQEYPKLA